MTSQKNKYWLKRRDQLFQKEMANSTKELSQQYLRLYHSVSADLLSLLEEIEKGIVHEGGINEREVLVSDLYKCDKYYNLLSNFTANAIKLGGKEVIEVNDRLTEMFNNQVQLTIEELGDSKSYSFFNPEQISKIVNGVWCSDGKTWSDRIWANKSMMEQDLRDGLVNIVAGGNLTSKELSAKLTQYLKDDINKGFNRALRLVQTELSFVQTQATLTKYQEAGVEYYEILAANGACSDCALNYNGQKYRVADAQVGVNCPPFHPNCRCTTLAIIGG